MAFPLGQTPDRIEDVSAERERLGLRRDAELKRRESARERHGDVRRARPVRARLPGGESLTRYPAAGDGDAAVQFSRKYRQISAARRRRNSRSPLSSGFSFFSLPSRWAMSGVKIQHTAAARPANVCEKASSSPEKYTTGHIAANVPARSALRRSLCSGRSATGAAAGAKPHPPEREHDRGNARPRLRREKERPRENARQLAAETVQRGAFEAHLPPVAEEDAKTVPEHRQKEDEQRAERGQARHGVRKEKPCAERREKADRQQRAPEGIEKPPALDGRERFAPPEEPRQILHVPAHPAVRAGKIAHRTGGEAVGQLHIAHIPAAEKRPLERVVAQYAPFGNAFPQTREIRPHMDGAPSPRSRRFGRRPYTPPRRPSRRDRRRARVQRGA